MLLKLEGFKCAMLLNLSMVFYHNQLSSYASNVCIIILPLGRYHFKSLPVRFSNSPDIFHHKMNDLFQWFECICYYKNDFSVLTTGD